MNIFRKKPILLLILVVACVIGVIFLVNFFVVEKNKVTPAESPTNVSLEEKEVLLYFNPNTITASSGGKISADIMIDAGDAPVSYVGLEVTYDTNALSNVTITPFQDPSSALSSSLISSVKSNTSGNTFITYTLVNGATQQKGKAILAKFQATYKGGKETTVTIFPDSTVSTKSNYRINVGRVNLDIFPR